MRKLLLPVILVIALVILPISSVLAATSADVTVTAVPGYIEISNAPSTWTINGIAGNGVLSANTTYYANDRGTTSDNISPAATGIDVVDNECYFTITNNSSCNCTVTVNFGNFVGGLGMNNSNDGSNTGTTFGAYSYYTGLSDYANKVLAKASGSTGWSDNLTAAQGTLKWGLEVLTQGDDWGSGSGTMTATVTLTATVAP